VKINDVPGAVARVLPSIPGPKTWMFYFPEFSSQSAAKAWTDAMVRATKAGCQPGLGPKLSMGGVRYASEEISDKKAEADELD
jgi:hypothetical protein